VSQFEYISVLLSIVLAFGLSEIVSGWGRLIRDRQRVRFYWIHGLWSALIALLIVQFWSGFWEYRDIESWSYFSLLVVLGDGLTLVAIAFLITPSVESERTLDLREYYFDNHRWIFGLGILSMLQLALVDATVGGQPVLHVENLIRGAAIALAGWLAVTKDERVHVAMLVVAYLLLAVFVVVLFRRP
jgi:hypothetical protein